MRGTCPGMGGVRSAAALVELRRELRPAERGWPLGSDFSGRGW